MTNETVEQELKTLSKTLRLEYEPQDWGIANADEQRLSEFIEFYRESQIDKKTKYQVFELILASANEALEKKHQYELTITALTNFLKDFESDFPEQLSYWTDLDDGEFPIARVLQQLD